ncbi:LCP family protein [Streptomyces sp. NPDC050504]|uniref:LCP family protein n=1 Tax=Streptomyces sp. NPDC050504 TaxID=3365618 RepID=UPI0037AFC9A7
MTQVIDAEPKHRRSRARRAVIVALVMLLLGLGALAGGSWWTVKHYLGKIDRMPGVFPTGEPPAEGKGGQNFLLVGIDARSDLPTTGKGAKGPVWEYGAQRSDTMLLVHIPADHSAAYFVSLPRDSWVDVPGHGEAKLNAAFSWGGPPLLIDTVQRLTDLRIDHLAVLDWDGFKNLTDALGGVDIPLADGTERHMNGKEALAYVRERKSLARGDLDRTHRQQNYLRSVLTETLANASLTSPLKTKGLLDKFTASVSVDDRLSDGDLLGLAWDLKGLRGRDLEFMNVPVTGTPMVRGQSTVELDRVESRRLWQAVRDDDMAGYLAGDREVDQLAEHPS